MLLRDILTRKRVTHRGGSDKAVGIARKLKDSERKVAFEMNLHVPCRVAGATKNGSRWEEETTTLSISSFGAHLLLPVDAELERDIVLTFKVPPPLAILFTRRKFRIKAEMQPSDMIGPSSTTMGRKAVCVVFSEPVYFSLKDARSRTLKKIVFEMFGISPSKEEA